MNEGGGHFEENNAVHRALRRIARRLKDIGVPYVVVGGMALFRHGFRRFTEDVDLLVTPEGLKRLHEELEGLGYVTPFRGSKHLRDVADGVRVEFLVTGQFPGDGAPKPLAFPDPADVAIEIDGINYLRLPTLIDLKLASGMTNPGRIKDLADVQEMIRILKLEEAFAEQLDPFVREKFLELRRAVDWNQE